jgi:hypothetical protein
LSPSRFDNAEAPASPMDCERSNSGRGQIKRLPAKGDDALFQMPPRENVPQEARRVLNHPLRPRRVPNGRAVLFPFSLLTLDLLHTNCHFQVRDLPAGWLR